MNRRKLRRCLDSIAALPMRPPAFSSVVFFPGVVTNTCLRGLQGMREQTVALDAAAGSNLPGERVSETGNALIRSAVFLLKLGCAYLAVCYGIPVPTIRIIEERIP